MAKLLRVSERRQITIPPSVMKDAGLSEGSYVAVEARDGKIVLEPQELSSKDLSRDDLASLDRLVQQQVRSKRFKEYDNPKDAKKHLK